jgi:hypothetical protein
MRIKKIVILVGLILNCGFLQAQRFFYIDNNHITENLLKGGLLKASQFITISPLSSDYIVKTEVGFQDSNHILTLQINLQDSVTFQSIFQVRETYAFGVIHANSRLLMRTLIRAFIEKNINQLVLSAKENHMNDRMNGLRARKDKT